MAISGLSIQKRRVGTERAAPHLDLASALAARRARWAARRRVESSRTRPRSQRTGRRRRSLGGSWRRRGQPRRRPQWAASPPNPRSPGDPSLAAATHGREPHPYLHHYPPHHPTPPPINTPPPSAAFTCSAFRVCVPECPRLGRPSSFNKVGPCQNYFLLSDGVLTTVSKENAKPRKALRPPLRPPRPRRPSPTATRRRRRCRRRSPRPRRPRPRPRSPPRSSRAAR